MKSLKKYLTNGFYFSYHYDMTASRQRRHDFEKKVTSKQIVPHAADMIACDDRYFWNKNILERFSENKVDLKWYTPLIQGHVGFVEEVVGDKMVSITLISRRQHVRTGTRMNVRGLDDDGNAGNFVETEQIVRIDQLIYSYVQTRGSVPVFWE